jgi:hypothetical protein
MAMDQPANRLRFRRVSASQRAKRAFRVLGQFVLTLSALLLSASAVRADMALVVSSHARTPELTQALELALRGYGVLVAYRPMGDARSPIERAALSQRVARNAGARVAVWIEPGPPARVRALGTAEHEERIMEAPLPTTLEQINDRAFGQIASSVILEALGMEHRNLPMAQSAEYMVPMPPWASPTASPWIKFSPVRSRRVRRPRRLRWAQRRTSVQHRVRVPA